MIKKDEEEVKDWHDGDCIWCGAKGKMGEHYDYCPGPRKEPYDFHESPLQGNKITSKMMKHLEKIFEEKLSKKTVEKFIKDLKLFSPSWVENAGFVILIAKRLGVKPRDIVNVENEVEYRSDL